MLATDSLLETGQVLLILLTLGPLSSSLLSLWNLVSHLLFLMPTQLWPLSPFVAGQPSPLWS